MLRLKELFPWIAACLVAAVLIGGYSLVAPPRDFPAGESIVAIAQGASAPAVAEQLGEERVIAHPALLRFLLRLAGASGWIRAGVYRFDAPENLFAVAYRITTGAYGLPLTRVTFIEGATVRAMAGQVAAAFPSVTESDFVAAAEPYQGYLFPDTYFFPPSATAASIVEAMRENFDDKTASLSDGIDASGHSLSDIVTMASIIEKEAKTPADRRLISGILWHRLALGMPLQVDAAPDTYQHTGLPPAPIANPGLDALEAAIHPTSSNYLYYLTGRDGLMHYATTFASHQANIRRYGLATSK